MTTRSIADPLAGSYITVVHRLLDELTANIEKTARIAELEAELARRDAYGVTVAEIVRAAGITDEDLEAEALEYGLPAFPAPFPNRFPIYNTWQEVPDGVVYEGVGDQLGTPMPYVNYNGIRYVSRPCGTPDRRSENLENEMAVLAPFVEVK